MVEGSRDISQISMKKKKMENTLLKAYMKRNLTKWEKGDTPPIRVRNII